MRMWLPEHRPKAVVIALHGMNDYSYAFRMPGEFLRKRGVAVYAYDQRGFGKNRMPGIWPGNTALVEDLKEIVTAIKQRYPSTPLFVLGESMGGAVAIAAFSHSAMPLVDGVILSAPAVWGGSSMNPFYRATLWAMAQIMPSTVLTGHDLHIMASDNIPMLIELGRDPLVQKGTRVDSILGLVRLMDIGYANMRKLHVPVLLLYGKQDQIIPPFAVASALQKVQDNITLAYYPQGYHLLLRDLHNHEVLTDMINWMDEKSSLQSAIAIQRGMDWLNQQNQLTDANTSTAKRRNIFRK